MNTWKTVVRHLEAVAPVYDVSEQGYSPYVSLVDDVRQVTCRRTLAAELRVRDDVGGWAW